MKNNGLKLKVKMLSLILVLSSINSLVYSKGLTYPLTTQTKIAVKKFKEDFRNVPDEYKLRNFWLWLNGIATKKSITQDLEAMKAKGFGGAIIADNGAPFGLVGPTFMSREWKELFAHAVKEADRLGIELSINIESGMGDPGNPKIQPDNGMKKIVFGEIKVVGPKKIQIEVPVAHSQIYYNDIAVQAYRSEAPGNINSSKIKNWEYKSLNREVPMKIETDRYDLQLYTDEFKDSMRSTAIDPLQIVDLSGHFSKGMLSWDVPPGQWTIMRYGMTATGKKNDYGCPGYRGGLCYDQINKRGVEAQWNDVAKPLIDLAKKSGNSLKYVHTDSWEMGMTNWTHGFGEEFAKRRGYDITRYLPVLANKIVVSREISNRFLEDFRLTVAELVVDENYAVLRERAHANGVLLHSESGGPHSAPIEGLKTLGQNDIPMGEFWGRANTHRVTEGQRLVVKQGSCAAHVYGKRFFGAEGPTTVGPVWERSPRDLKGIIDQVFCNGVNRIYWHTYTSSPDEYGLPGIEYFAGTHFNRNVTWFNQSDSFVNYINRCQFILGQGLYSADILSYYGSEAPNYVFLDSDVKDVPPGYAWDMCNSEVLLSRASVKKGRIYLPDGMNYKLLVLMDHKAISLGVLKKIEQMVNEGITLVGNPPERAYGLSGYPESDNELKAIVKKLWGKTVQKNIYVNRYGKGKVYSGKTIAEVLKIESVAPDFSYTATHGVEMQYIHRSTDNLEIYYVTNKWARHGINDFIYRYQTDVPDSYIQAMCTFRVGGEREVERWDPLTGEITPVTIYKQENGQS